MIIKTITMAHVSSDLKIDPFDRDKKDPLGLFSIKGYVPEVIEDIMKLNPQPGDTVEVVYDDDTVIVHNFAEVIINIMFWRIYLALTLPVLPKHYLTIPNITEDLFPKIHTRMIPRCLKMIGSTNVIGKKRLHSLFFDSIATFQNFSIKYCSGHVTTVSYLESCKLLTDPKLKEICDMTPINDFENSRDVEIRISNKINSFLETVQKDFQHTNLHQKLRAGTYNKNQLAQLYIGYGPRSDINDRILGDPIRSSTIRGLSNIKEFALESLASKKSARYNAFMVSDSSYINRKGQLGATEIYRIRKHPCKNNKTRKTFICRGFPKRYVGKAIIINGKEEFITYKNISELEGSYVDMISLLDCGYKNDVCVRCLGRMHEFIPHDFHLGLITATELFSKIVQKILSAKHLVKTFTIVYVFTPEMEKYFNKTSSGFSLKPLPKGWYIGIDKNYLINPSTLTPDTIKDTDISTVSSISEIHIFDENGCLVDTVNFNQKPNNPSLPFVTEKLLLYCCENPELFKLDATNCYIYFNKWKYNTVFLRTNVINYDMTSYVDNISKFIENHVATYTDAAKALEKLSELIYSKTETHISMIEIILRSLLIAGPNDYDFPLPEREEDTFGKLEDIINNRSFTSRLVFEKLFTLDKKNSMLQPEAYFKKIATGLFAPFFGLD